MLQSRLRYVNLQRNHIQTRGAREIAKYASSKAENSACSYLVDYSGMCFSSVSVELLRSYLFVLLWTYRIQRW